MDQPEPSFADHAEHLSSVEKSAEMDGQQDIAVMDAAG